MAVEEHLHPLWGAIGALTMGTLGEGASSVGTVLWFSAAAAARAASACAFSSSSTVARTCSTCLDDGRGTGHD